jgi:hypothetical protein
MEPIPVSSPRSAACSTRAEELYLECPHERVYGFESDLGWACCDGCGATLAPEVFKRKTGGRPSSFTVDVQERIIEGVGQGEYTATAAAAAGISGETLRLWLDSKDPLFKSFQKRLRKAKGEFRARMERLAAVQKPEYWLKHVGRNSMAPAEFPDDRWTDYRQVDGKIAHAHVHAHVPVSASEIDYSKLTKEQLDALEAAHLALGPTDANALPEHAGNVIDADVVDDEADDE